MGWRLWRQQPHQRRSCRDRQPRCIRTHGGRGRRPRLSADARYGGGICLRRRRHRLEPVAGSGWRQERCLPGRRVRRHPLRPGLSRGGLRLRQPLDVDRPVLLCRRPPHREVQRAEHRRTPRRRLSLGWMFGGITPYAAIQAQSFRTPDYNETDVNGGGFGLGFAGRTATDTRSELGARFDNQMLLYPGAVLALRARLAWAHDWVSDPDPCGGVPDASGRELHRQRCDAGTELRAGIGRRGASACQRRLVARQIRRRVCIALNHLWRHGDNSLSVVTAAAAFAECVQRRMQRIAVFCVVLCRIGRLPLQNAFP